MKSQVIMVTPEKARDWLGRKGKNRTISQRHVRSLADEMVLGRWELNGVPIIFDSMGNLVDGQHRLEAVVLSKESILMLIVSGVESARAFETIDVLSRGRGVHQIAQMDGIKNANAMTAVARRLLLWEQTPNKKEFSLYLGHLSLAPQNLIDYLREHEREIAGILDQVKGTSLYCSCGAGAALTTALVICNRVDEVATMLFIDAIVTGEFLARDSGALQLRNKLMNRTERKNNRVWETELMALTIKAWNYYSDDKPLKLLAWRQEGNKPEYFPIPRGDNSCLKLA